MATSILTQEEQQLAGAHLLAQGREYLAAGNFAEAVLALQRAATVMPLSLDVYRPLADALEANGQQADALSARMAILAFEQGSATDLGNIGTVYFKHRHWVAAAHWYRLALMLDPDLVAANMNMASIMRRDDRLAEADYHRDRAYRRQTIFIEAAVTPLRNILVLSCSRHGNVPLEFLLPHTTNQLIKWVIEYGTAGDVQQLPHYDLVFNAIGDADTAAPSRSAVNRFLAVVDKPVLNSPARVERTSRDRIGPLLGDIDGLHVPVTIRWDRRQSGAAEDAHALIAAAGLSYPVIARPVGEHGGKGLVLLQSPQEMAAAPLGAEVYFSSYCDYRSSDGYFRKYRVIFVDRRPYPYHLAIGSQWVLHYATADMLSMGWKTEEEHRFLDDPAGVLGPVAWAALEAMAQRLDLDFCGVDFSILPDGRLLVFETNATMLVHPEDYHEALKFKNPYVQRIFDAFDQMLDRRMGRADPA